MALLMPPPALSPAPASAPSPAALATPPSAPVAAPVAAPLQAAAAAPTATPRAGAAVGFWLQLGAFRMPEGAASLQQRVQRETDGLAAPVAVFGDGGTYRVQAGPYATRADALASAERLRHALQLSPLVVERR
jgi:rare lipoprotein A